MKGIVKNKMLPMYLNEEEEKLLIEIKKSGTEKEIKAVKKIMKNIKKLHYKTDTSEVLTVILGIIKKNHCLKNNDSINIKKSNSIII